VNHSDHDHSNDGSRYHVVECLIAPDDLEWASAELYDLGTVGIEELDPSALTSPRDSATSSDQLVGLRAGFPSQAMAHEALEFLLSGESQRETPWLPKVEVIVGDDWLDAWREHFAPLRAGRIVVAPAWKQHDGSLDEDPVLATLGAQDIVLWLEPGRAWGTGAHQSTSLCLSALQRLFPLDQAAQDQFVPDRLVQSRLVQSRLVQDRLVQHRLVQHQRLRHPVTVLDVGCGSGVLGVAALLLGASSAFGVDIDATSPGVTMDNARRNGVADRCAASTEPVGDVVDAYQLVLANILAPVLIDLAVDVANRVEPGGALILAGLIEEQRERVLAAYPGFLLEHTEYQGEWVGLTLRRLLNSPFYEPGAEH
jgi:ribosomal protein L11 methyltransferase